MKKLAVLLCLFLFFISAYGCTNNTEEEDNVNYTIELSQLPFRDICVMPDPVSKKYYMVGFLKSMSAAQEVACYQSKDLQKWGGYKTAMYNDGQWDQSWAPEIRYYNGSYYLFASLKKAGSSTNGDLRGCYILKSDKPDGEYKAYSDRITPENWECLDGTLYVEDGVPYMVYCREWTRLNGNGEMYAVQLKDDLSGVAEGAEHKLLFRAKDHPASTDGVTDGPWLYNAENGDLVMLWSKYVNGGYAIITSRSKTGVMGEWSHDPAPLFADDGGHAMLFEDFDGNMKIAFHENSTNKGNERPVIYSFIDENGALRIDK